jgi:ferrous iron transport protein A
MLPPGQWAEVTRIAGEPASVGRMAEIGLHVGSRFRMLRCGSPCLLEVHGARLSLRTDRKMTIIARPVSAEFKAMTLDQLPVGQRAHVAEVAGSDSLMQRLMEMGLFEGEEIEVLGVAPLGDPLEIGLRDYRLSLRRNEAACIRVTTP